MARSKKNANQKVSKPKRSRAIKSTSRSLLNSSLIQSQFRVSGQGRSMTATGVEYVDQLVTSVVPATQVITINPSLATTFPRLSNFASQFEQYRFKKLRLIYQTGAPATRSGVFGMAIRTSYTGSVNYVPVFAPDFASFEYSSIGSIAENLQTPWWINKDPEFFFIYSNTNQGSSQKTNQAEIMTLTRDSVSPDNDLLAGYLAIEYEVEFLNMRPAAKKQYIAALSTGIPSTSDTIGPATHSYPDLPYVGTPSSDGPWYIDYGNQLVSGLGVAAKVWGDVTRGINMVSSMYGAVGAVSLEEDEKDYYRMPTLRRSSGNIREWQNPLSFPKGSKMEVEARRRLSECKTPDDVKDFLSPPEIPLAAGDVVVTLWYKYPGSGENLHELYIKTFNTSSAGPVSASSYFQIPAPDDSSNAQELQPAVFWDVYSADSRSWTYELASMSVSETPY